MADPLIYWAWGAQVAKRLLRCCLHCRDHPGLDLGHDGNDNGYGLALNPGASMAWLAPDRLAFASAWSRVVLRSLSTCGKGILSGGGNRQIWHFRTIPLPWHQGEGDFV